MGNKHHTVNTNGNMFYCDSIAKESTYVGFNKQGTHTDINDQ